MSITEKEIAMRSLFSRRLGSLIESHGIQQNDLAMKIGVSESTVGKWILKKAMPRMGTIQKLADYFGVPKSYFLEESTAAPQDAPAASASFEYTLIPVGISAGQMEDCEALSLLPKISVPDVIMGPYARDPHIVFTRVNGESMNRVIDNGATIAVMTGLERCQIQNGDIVIARYDGAGYTIKRYYDLPEKHQIILTPDSDDPGFLPIPINYESPDDLRIFGRVVMYSVIL